MFIEIGIEKIKYSPDKEVIAKLPTDAKFLGLHRKPTGHVLTYWSVENTEQQEERFVALFSDNSNLYRVGIEDFKSLVYLGQFVSEDTGLGYHIVRDLSYRNGGTKPADTRTYLEDDEIPL